MALDQSVERRPVTGSATAVRDRGTTVAAALVIAGTVLISMVVRYLLALDQTAPWLMGDELRYADMAKSFLDEGRLLFREEPIAFVTAYPVLIAPAWAAAEIETAYEIAKAINVVLMTSSAAIVYLWIRRLVSTPYALVAAGLVLLMPTFAYTGMLMMENAALPAFLLGAFVIARTIERPTIAWQLAVFAAMGGATLLRVQLATLALVYLTAILLDAVFASRAGHSIRASLKRFVLSLVLIVVGALGYLTLKLLTGSSLSSGLGGYATVGEVEYDLGQVARWFAWHVGELAVSVAFLPAVAFGVLLAIALQRGSLPTAADRAFVAVASASVFWFVLQAAAFASRFSERLEERYMVYAAPLLLMALVVWVGRAWPRPTLSMFVAGVVPMVLAMTIPLERVFNISLIADTFGLIPFMRLSDLLEGGIADVRLVLAGGLAVGAIAFVTFDRRIARVLFPAAVALFFVLSSYSVYGTLEDQSTATRASSGVSDPSWIDDTLGRSGQAGFIFSAGLNANPHVLYQTEFWNRSVRDVYAFNTDDGAIFGGPDITLDARGRLVPKPGDVAVDEPYVLAEPNLAIVGEVVAKPGPLALIRVDPPVRISSSVDGLYADGWTGPQAGLSQYEPLPGGARRMQVRVSRAGWTGADVPGRVTITAGQLRQANGAPTMGQPTATREWTVHSGQTGTFDLPVPPAPFRIEVRVAPTFSPAQFGQADTRQLGVQLAFSSG